MFTANADIVIFLKKPLTHCQMERSVFAFRKGKTVLSKTKHFLPQTIFSDINPHTVLANTFFANSTSNLFFSYQNLKNQNLHENTQKGLFWGVKSKFALKTKEIASWKVTFRHLKMTFRNLKMTFRLWKMTLGNWKMIFRFRKVMLEYKNMTFGNRNMTFEHPKVIADIRK